jgi:hypothetical protein
MENTQCGDSYNIEWTIPSDMKELCRNISCQKLSVESNSDTIVDTDKLTMEFKDYTPSNENSFEEEDDEDVISNNNFAEFLTSLDFINVIVNKDSTIGLTHKDYRFYNCIFEVEQFSEIVSETPITINYIYKDKLLERY